MHPSIARPSSSPQGLLLIGMGEDECAAVASWFHSMEPGFVVACCPAALLAQGSLRQALGGEGAGGPPPPALPQWAWEAQPRDAPPVAFFSGMSGEEQVGLMEAWGEHTGLQAPAFASGAGRGWGRRPPAGGAAMHAGSLDAVSREGCTWDPDLTPVKPWSSPALSYLPCLAASQ